MPSMNKNIEALIKTLSPQSSQQALKSNVRAIYSENDHATNICPITSFSDKEQVNFVGQEGYSSKHNPYSNIYNPGWRDHPNFNYANQRNVLNPSQGNTQLQGTAPGFSKLKKSSLEDSITALAQSQLAFQQSTQVFQQQTQAAIQTTQASLQKLEIQMGQLASTVNEREKGKFPSQPIANPKGVYEISSSSNHHPSHEKVKSITTLKSGTQMDNKVQMAKEDRETNVEKNEAVDVKGKNAQAKERSSLLFKKVHINIPLLEAIKQIPSYAKFLKGLCSHKCKLNGEEKVFLTKKLSDIYLWKNPSKLQDPGIPTLSCVIGSHKFEEALVDHGASVNLTPYSVYVELGLGELKRSPITLEFVDGSVKKSCGVIEDVLMQIDKFYYPMDFIVLDTGPVHYLSTKIPIILGRPLLATAKANIQCDTGVLTLCFGDMKAQFDLYPTLAFNLVLIMLKILVDIIL
ncbi:uncharacterized protein LOC126631387 [Malus sylvestris]|uniref:uncharacterized protein LOC126631387 n=1 Tax=Malus sylvestris TaxID=3752 RepID=UPI0021ABFF52|nr:uncharacterized protein LOC126631387 [Malus sylvestris]